MTAARLAAANLLDALYGPQGPEVAAAWAAAFQQFPILKEDLIAMGGVHDVWAQDMAGNPLTDAQAREFIARRNLVLAILTRADVTSEDFEFARQNPEIFEQLTEE
ncbi:MAG: hypothetical protein AAFU34_15580 [Pseudomonadota bacterium]